MASFSQITIALIGFALVYQNKILNQDDQAVVKVQPLTHGCHVRVTEGHKLLEVLNKQDNCSINFLLINIIKKETPFFPLPDRKGIPLACFNTVNFCTIKLLEFICMHGRDS